MTKSPAWNADQFLSAVAECRAVESRGEDASEALHTCLDRLYTLMSVLPAVKQVDQVRALRFARARRVHQNASLVYRDGDGPSTWRPLSQLAKPAPNDMHRYWNGADATQYDLLLAGRPMMGALDAAEAAVRAAV